MNSAKPVPDGARQADGTRLVYVAGMLQNALLLAQVDAEDVSAGPLGLLVMVLMGVATVLLVRNMNGRLKRLPTTFESSADDSGAPTGGPGHQQRTDDTPDASAQ